MNQHMNQSMDMDQPLKSPVKKPYIKPRLRRVELRPQEAVLGNCKQVGQAGCGNNMMDQTVTLGS